MIHGRHSHSLMPSCLCREREDDLVVVLIAWWATVVMTPKQSGKACVPAISYLCLQCATQSTAAGSDDGDGSSSEPSRGCRNSAGCAFAMKGVPRYTRRFSRSGVP